MQERIREMWPPPQSTQEARSIYMANSTASLQHEPWYNIAVPSSLQRLVGTNSFLSTNTILHSWQYLMGLWAYAAGAITFGLTSILTLPDPDTIERINEEREAFYDQLANGDSSYEDLENEESVNEFEELPTENQSVRRSKVRSYKPEQKHRVQIPIEKHDRFPVMHVKTSSVQEPIERQSSYVGYEKEEERKEETRYKEKSEEVYVYPGRNKYGNYPPNLNHQKDTWALKMYSKFMDFYNYHRAKLNSKKPQTSYGYVQQKGKDKRTPYNYGRPYPSSAIQPSVVSYGPGYGHPALNRPMVYQPHFIQQPVPTPQYSSSFKTFSNMPITSYQAKSDELSSDSWKAVTHGSAHSNQHHEANNQQLYHQTLKSNEMALESSNPHSAHTKQLHPGFLRMPQPHSLLHQIPNTDASRNPTKILEPVQNDYIKSEESIPFNFQDPKLYSLLQQPNNGQLYFKPEDVIPVRNEKTPKHAIIAASYKNEAHETASLDEDIPIGFQEPEKHSIFLHDANNGNSDYSEASTSDGRKSSGTNVAFQNIFKIKGSEEESNPSSYLGQYEAVTERTVKQPLNTLYLNLFNNSSRGLAATSKPISGSSGLNIEPVKLLSSYRQTVEPAKLLPPPAEETTTQEVAILKLQPVYSPQQTGEEVSSPVRRDGNMQDIQSDNGNEQKYLEQKMPSIKLPPNARLTTSAEKIYNTWLKFQSQLGQKTT